MVENLHYKLSLLRVERSCFFHVLRVVLHLLGAKNNQILIACGGN